MDGWLGGEGGEDNHSYPLEMQPSVLCFENAPLEPLVYW